MPRYMTDAGKARALGYWDQAKASRPADAPEGTGHPDPAIYDLVDRLNALPHLCTLQSCAGHALPDPTRPGQTYHHSAQLWVWLVEFLALRVYRHAPRLADHPLIERVSVTWVAGDTEDEWREVIDIVFKGQWHPDWLEAQRHILRFFQQRSTAS